jgi:hypothetical protein
LNFIFIFDQETHTITDMAIYRFRVTFEDHDEVSRDVEIRATQSFDDLHHAIHSAIGFDASKPASFYMSDDHWTKGKEISNRELNETEKENVTTFRKSRLCDYIADPHQKIYYVFDPVEKWSFRVELIKILAQEEIGVFYPRCTKVNGEAPKQYISTAPPAVPSPEDFDPDTIDDILDDEDDFEEDEDTTEEVVAEADEVKGMGELDTNEESEESDDDEFETADDEMSEDDMRENEEF